MNAVEEQRDTWARDNEFLVLSPGQAYQRQVNRSGMVFIYTIDNGRWIVVYDNTWTDDKGREHKKFSIKAGATKDGTNIFGTTWDKAIDEAMRFVKFISRGRRSDEWKSEKP